MSSEATITPGVARSLGKGRVVAAGATAQHAADAGAGRGEEVALTLAGDQIRARETADEPVGAASAEQAVGSLPRLDQLATRAALNLVVARPGADPGALAALRVGDFDHPILARAEVDGAVTGARVRPGRPRFAACPLDGCTQGRARAGGRSGSRLVPVRGLVARRRLSRRGPPRRVRVPGREGETSMKTWAPREGSLPHERLEAKPRQRSLPAPHRLSCPALPRREHVVERRALE